ncbi:hypothetical protein BLX87_22590, partial [Bacillus sp. VT-16-64]
MERGLKTKKKKKKNKKTSPRTFANKRAGGGSSGGAGANSVPITQTPQAQAKKRGHTKKKTENKPGVKKKLPSTPPVF